MNAILMQVLITIFAGLVLAYAGYRLGLRRFQFEREIAQVDDQKREESKRIEGMLQYLSKIQTSANLANTNQDHALGLLRESRAWFDANCISYLKEEPYKSFNFVLKLTSGYVADPVIFAKAQVNRGGYLFIFEQITELQKKLEAKLAELRASQIGR